MNNYTPEDLVLYLYEETSPEKSSTIEEALSKDWALREKFAVLKASKERIDNFSISPRTEAVLKVLSYARNTETVEQ